MKFEHNYLIYDEFGEKEILCMSCAKPIKTRVEARSKLDDTKIIREVMKHADYREIPVILSDGNIAFIMVCDDCKFCEVDAEKVTTQLRKAAQVQLEWGGKTADVVEAILNKIERKVIRRAELDEVANAMKGMI